MQICIFNDFDLFQDRLSFQTMSLFDGGYLYLGMRRAARSST